MNAVTIRKLAAGFTVSETAGRDGTEAPIAACSTLEQALQIAAEALNPPAAEAAASEDEAPRQDLGYARPHEPRPQRAPDPEDGA